MGVRVGGHGTYKFGCKEESSRMRAHAQEEWAQFGSSRQEYVSWVPGQRVRGSFA